MSITEEMVIERLKMEQDELLEASNEMDHDEWRSICEVFESAFIMYLRGYDPKEVWAKLDELETWGGDE